MESKRCSVSIKGLAELLTIITLLGVAPVASIAADSPRGCDPGAAAAEYDRKADEYEAAADERYRAWARARVAADQCGGASDLEQAARLYAAAKESRVRAAESRSRDDSTGALVDGCSPQAPADVHGSSSMH